MNAHVTLAHGEQLFAAFIFLVFAGGSSLVCAFVAAVLYFSDKTQKQRLKVVGMIWLMAVVLSLAIAAVAGRS